MLKLSLISLFAFLIYYLFSPWRVVIEIRSASLPSVNDSHPGDVSVTLPKNETVEQIEKIGKKDVIQQHFGVLEKEFQISIENHEPNTHQRSRDESIKLLYSIETPAQWTDLINSHDPHGLMALTQETQQYIYSKQNPSKCNSQNYLILNKFPGDDSFGLGAIIERIGNYLSVAIQTNSILLYAEDLSPGEHFIQDPKNGGDEICGRSFNCIFQPLSSCSDEKQKGLPKEVQSLFTPESHEEAMNLDTEAYIAKGTRIPPILEDALRQIQPDITDEMLKYWWRAQASAYIMRLNGLTAKRLKELRLGTDVKQLGIQWDIHGHPQKVNLPFPMPEATYSMHVRHGDKGSEMRLVPFNDYAVRAEKHGAQNPFGTWKRAFLSTEDPNVIEQMKSMARVTSLSESGSNARWTWYWSDIPRMNTGPETQLNEFGNRTDMTIKWILQLVMAIECDAFVGTRGSGWNRLIDSLRCIWLASCKQPFLEVGFENDWAHYGPL